MPAAPEHELEINVGEYVKTLQRHWRLIVALVVVSLSVSLVRYAMTPKAYRASTMIQIERGGLATLTGGQNPWLENYWNLEYYPTQYRLLQSRGLAERVVKNLRLNEDPAFNPGAASAKSAGLTAEDDRAMLGALAGGIMGGLEVNPIKNTQLVELAYSSTSAELAARVANGVADAYIDWGIETRSETAGKASSFLGAQIETIKQEIADKDAQLQAYGRRTDIVTLDPTSNVVLQRLSALNSDYIAAVSERINAEARLNQLLTASKDAIADSLGNGLIASMRADQLKLERDYATKLTTYKPEWPAMVELKAQIDRGKKSLDSLIDENLTKEREKARSDLQTAQRKEQSLIAQLNTIKSENMQMNSAAVEYNNLKMEISTRRTLLDDMMKKQSETGVASRLEGTRESNVRIVDRALVPGGPFQPSLRKSVTYGLLFGFVLGVAAVLVIEYLDRTIKTPEELQRLMGLPTLAVIPDISEDGTKSGYRYGYSYGYGYGGRSKKGPRKKATSGIRKADDQVPIELMPQLRPRTVVSEAYRALRTSLLLSSADELRVVAVTSSESGEGKTATSVNLAVVMAQLGKRVLLIDSDLRKPRIHQVFKCSNRLGLVSALTGTVKPEEIFLRTEVPNLFITPSGPIPPNPSELLASHRMRELITAVRGAFDFVVIDTPPVLAVTDSTLVGSITDGIVLCLRARSVVREDARACRERLRLADVRVLGTVLNRYRVSHGNYGKRYEKYEAYVEPLRETGESAA
jgi:capsular exopolysaccharide synthesis family protein